MRVWVVTEQIGQEMTHVVGVYATAQLAKERVRQIRRACEYLEGVTHEVEQWSVQE